MKFKYALPLVLASACAGAEQYQSITEAEYTNTDFGSAETGLFTLGSTYYFSPKNTLGPLKEFDYINTVNNVFGGLTYLDAPGGDSGARIVGGEYFAGQVKVGGSLVNGDGLDLYGVSLGYLVSPNFLAEVEAIKVNDADTEIRLRGQYTHQISAVDYLGFTAEVDDSLENREISAKYLTQLAGGRYLSAGYALASSEFEGSIWRANAELFFNQETSVGFVYDKVENYELNATHFFNRSVAAKVAYGSSRDLDDLNRITLGLTVQL